LRAIRSGGSKLSIRRPAAACWLLVRSLAYFRSHFFTPPFRLHSRACALPTTPAGGMSMPCCVRQGALFSQDPETCWREASGHVVLWGCNPTSTVAAASSRLGKGRSVTVPTSGIKGMCQGEWLGAWVGWLVGWMGLVRAGQGRAGERIGQWMRCCVERVSGAQQSYAGGRAAQLRHYNRRF